MAEGYGTIGPIVGQKPLPDEPPEPVSFENSASEGPHDSQPTPTVVVNVNTPEQEDETNG